MSQSRNLFSMTIDVRLAVVFGLLSIAVIAGLVWKSRTGKAHQVRSGEKIDLQKLAATKAGLPVSNFGERATLLQFSTEVCSICVQTSRYLGELEKRFAGLLHIEVDVTHRMDLAAHFGVMQTPTTLILDPSGRIVSRIGGSPKPEQIKTELEKLNVSNTIWD